MKLLAIIPARAGSKRLKNKNFRILGSKPLFMHLVDKIKNLKSISKIIISTDYKKIDEKKFSKKIQIDLRKKKLANDKSTVLETVIDIAKKYKEYDYIGFFLPTCPFISVKDIKAGIKKLKNYDAVVSIMPFDDPIQIALKYNLKSKIIKPIFDHLRKNKTNSKYIEKSYKPSGGFYFVKRKLLLKKKTLYLRNICGILYSEKKYVDIDTLENFKYAEYLLNIR